MLGERRLCWLGHVIQVDRQRIPDGRCTGRFWGLRDHPRTNWRNTVNKNLLRMGITWEEAEVAAQNRSEWHWSVAQCGPLRCGSNKGQGQSFYAVAWIRASNDLSLETVLVLINGMFM